MQRIANKQWQLGITFEFTSRETPQKNHLVELGFAAMHGRGRAMMVAANIPLDKRYILWREAFSTATKVDWLTAIKINKETKTRYQHTFGKDPRFQEHLRTFGKAGTVTIKETRPGKIKDRGVQCVFVGTLMTMMAKAIACGTQTPTGYM